VFHLRKANFTCKGSASEKAYEFTSGSMILWWLFSLIMSRKGWIYIRTIITYTLIIITKL